MTTAAPHAPPDALLSVREALLARAEAEAAQVLADADAEAASTIARARAEADAVRADARAQGEADAAAVLAEERARARRQARALVLAAQRESYEALHARALRDALDLRADPTYAAWRDRVRQRVREALGPDAVVTEHPEGGVLGEVPGRRAAYTLAGLAEQALASLGPDVAGLWAP